MDALRIVGNPGSSNEIEAAFIKFSILKLLKNW